MKGVIVLLLLLASSSFVHCARSIFQLDCNTTEYKRLSKACDTSAVKCMITFSDPNADVSSVAWCDTAKKSCSYFDFLYENCQRTETGKATDLAIIYYCRNIEDLHRFHPYDTYYSDVLTLCEYA